ncbi:hypothetical protein AGMMS4952_25690 [Spirochaetia bacterium]|nr:hypothetical protein AGMMS4952_25690 [Spirochaetia bacterium]
MNNTQKKSRWFLSGLFFLSLLTVISCKVPTNDEKTVQALFDSRFNGTFVYYRIWTALDEIDEDYEKTVIRFNGTNRASWETTWYSYRASSGWTWSGAQPGDGYSGDIEIEINNGKYRVCNWYNNEQFTNWADYRFEDDDLALQLDGFAYNVQEKPRSFYKEDISLKGNHKIIYDWNGGEGGYRPGVLYSTGPGEFVLCYRGAYRAASGSLYAFSHWNSKPGGNGDSYSGNEYLFYNDHDITLYAIWSHVNLSVLGEVGK